MPTLEGPNYPQIHGRTLERVLFDRLSGLVRDHAPGLIFVANLHPTGSFFNAVLRIGAPGYLPDKTDVLRTRSKTARFTMGQLS